MALKLDKQLESALGVRSPEFDKLRMLGLTGQQIRQSAKIPGQGISLTGDQAGHSSHIKGKVYPNQTRNYVSPRKEVSGLVITSRTLKNKSYASGVYFPCEEETVIEAGVTGQPGEEYVNLSPERWDGKKVNMNGTQTSRNHGGFRGVKPRKGWKRYESK